MCDKNKTDQSPDGRGKRPADPNQLALWIVEQSTENRPEEAKSPEISLNVAKDVQPPSKP